MRPRAPPLRHGGPRADRARRPARDARAGTRARAPPSTGHVIFAALIGTTGSARVVSSARRGEHEATTAVCVVRGEWDGASRSGRRRRVAFLTRRSSSSLAVYPSTVPRFQRDKSPANNLESLTHRDSLISDAAAEISALYRRILRRNVTKDAPRAHGSGRMKASYARDDTLSRTRYPRITVEVLFFNAALRGAARADTLARATRSQTPTPSLGAPKASSRAASPADKTRATEIEAFCRLRRARVSIP